MLEFVKILFTPMREHRKMAEKMWLDAAEDHNDLAWRREQVQRGMFRPAA